jgi:hypothetical protein
MDDETLSQKELNLLRELAEHGPGLGPVAQPSAREIEGVIQWSTSIRRPCVYYCALAPRR